VCRWPNPKGERGPQLLDVFLLSLAMRAEKVGIDRSFLADVERGKRNVSILNLELISKGLSVSLSQLLSRL
jgi:transcriptional regulator with XRE-family HTH domain